MCELQDAVDVYLVIDERFGLAHGYEFRHYRYIVRRYLLRKDFEISYHFLLFHFLSPLELDLPFRATGGGA